MENHIHHQTKVLSMDNSCEICAVILKKKLLKMPGVNTVTIDTESNLVYVVGNIDATTLRNRVAKISKAVKLLPADKHPRRNEGMGDNFGRAKWHGKDGSHRMGKKFEVKEEHKSEAYVPPSIDPRTCRDYYCKTHLTGRDIVDNVPAESSTLFGMGQMPFYSSYGPPPYGGGPYQYPGWYREEPPQFGYGRPPQYLPRRPFGFLPQYLPRRPFGFQ